MAKNNLIIKISKKYEEFKRAEEVWKSLEAILTLTTLLFLLIFAIAPTVKVISSLLNEIESKEELSVKMKTKIDQVIEAQINYADVQQKMFLMDQYYPVHPRVSEGTAQLFGISKKYELENHGLSLSKINLAQTGETELAFSFAAQGDYPGIKRFLENIYQSRRGVVVEGYSFSSLEEDEQEEKGQPNSVGIKGKFLIFQDE